jgi:hypothetical protein
VQSSGDPLQNALTAANAAASYSDTFYSGDRTTALWGAANDAQGLHPGSGRGLDSYRITNPFNPFGPYLAGQGQAQGAYPTEPSAGGQARLAASPAGSNANAQQSGGSNNAGLIIVALVVAVLLSR